MTENKFSLENYVRPTMVLPNNKKNLLLHSCCAPCAGEIMEALIKSNICLLYTSDAADEE